MSYNTPVVVLAEAIIASGLNKVVLGAFSNGMGSSAMASDGIESSIVASDEALSCL